MHPVNPHHVVVLVTAPSTGVGRTLARTALEQRLVACANLVPGVESHYWWEGKLEQASETLLVMKTTEERVAELQACIVAAHPYDTPEFVVLPIVGGSNRYLDWVTKNVAHTTTTA